MVNADSSVNWLVVNTLHNTHLTALFPGLPGWAGTRKVTPIWISVKQETVSGSGISWAVCKSAPHSRQITTPATHNSGFLQAGCPSCHPTNSIKALKALQHHKHTSYSILQAYTMWPGIRIVFFHTTEHIHSPILWLTVLWTDELVNQLILDTVKWMVQVCRWTNAHHTHTHTPV